jgi:hypothetical protein
MIRCRGRSVTACIPMYCISRFRYKQAQTPASHWRIHRVESALSEGAVDDNSNCGQQPLLADMLSASSWTASPRLRTTSSNSISQASTTMRCVSNAHSAKLRRTQITRFLSTQRGAAVVLAAPIRDLRLTLVWKHGGQELLVSTIRLVLKVFYTSAFIRVILNVFYSSFPSTLTKPIITTKLIAITCK